MSNASVRLIALAAFVAATALGSSSCEFSGYCLDCADPDGGDGDGDNDGGDGDGDGGSATDAGTDAEPCIPSGIEQCDGIDNDCNGQIDDGDIPGTGEVCSSDVGECEEGTTACTAGEIVCAGGVVAAVETCDTLDNDCDGDSDEGNPGGGNICGTDMGECVSGVTQCASGALDCVGDIGGGAESCDGRDNDCDGAFDEGTGGGQCGPVSDMGLCEFGTFMCIGGQIQCQGATMPSVEVCDNMDHDCDGDNENGFDTETDVQNCGMCGTNCYDDPDPDNLASRVCIMSECAIGACETNFHDVNGEYMDGCEYGPCEIAGEQEACNGIDDNCNDMIDEALGTPPAVCNQQGECNGTVAMCAAADGWICNYGPTVSTDASGAIVPEVSCDGLDNDCDGFVDEAFPTKGAACDDGELGVCRGVGTFVCNAAGTGLECMIDDPGMNPSTETCENSDEDCDGTIDEGDHQLWIDVGGGVEMFAYEASRPDSSSTSQGLETTLPCSKAGTLPWTNVTHPEAEALCQAIGARLCSESEWESTCEAGASCEWSYASNCTTYQPSTCNGNDFDTDSGTAGDQDAAVPTASRSQCTADVGGGDVFDLSGNIKEWTAERSADVNPIRGGSYNNNDIGISCGHDFLVADDTFFFPNVGFRCCR